MTIRPPPTPDQRQERLDHRDRAEEVDLELLAEVGHRLELDRRRLADARVVDEAREAVLAHGPGDHGRRRRDRRFVRDVDDQRRQSLRRLGLERVAIGLAPYAREDVEPLVARADVPLRRRCRWTCP